MTLADRPTSPPSQEFVSARARRRRARRTFFPRDAEGRAAFLAVLARRAYPSYELFVFAVVCGAILGLGYLFDSQALLIFGVLVAPLMTPWVGMTLAVVTGSVRFFFQTIIAIFISALLIFLIGLIAGFASRPFLPLTLNEAFTHSRLWWPDLIILALGSIVLTISFVRSEDRPYLPSVVLSYEFFLPLSAAGFGLGSGVTNLWPHGLFVFLVHLAWATLFGILTLLALRFHPVSFGGLAFSGIIFLTLAAALVLLMGFGKWTMELAGLATPPPATATVTIPSPQAFASITPSAKPAPATALIGDPAGETETPTPSPVPVTLEVTLPPTETPTFTVTAEPTPILARIKAPEGGGAYVRERPGGKVLATLDNGAIITILPDLQDVNGIIWIHVVATVNDIRIEGWIIQTVLETATPVANWLPSPTASFTTTP